jgi:type I restriction enzyme R subunit
MIIDEAHSSQSGRMAGNANQVLSGEDDENYDEYEEKGINKQVRKYAEGRKMAEGLAYEREDSTFINKTSYLENCET